MKLKFLKDAELTVVENIEMATDEINSVNEIFKKDEVIDVDLFGESSDTIDIQFGDGSVIVGLSKTLFKIIEG